MGVLGAGLKIARRKPWLVLTLFVGEGLVGLLPLAGLAVLVVALLTGLRLGALASPQHDPLASALATLHYLLQPTTVIGVGGALVVCGLITFGLGAFLRGGTLASLVEALRPASRFSLRAFGAGGLRLLDRTAPLALLEALVPWATLAFFAPALFATRRPLLALLSDGQPLPLSAAGLLGLAGAGAGLLGLVGFAWVNLALVEVALRPGLPASRALADGARALVSGAGPLLRFGLTLLLLWGGAFVVYGLAVGGLTTLSSNPRLALLGSAAQPLLDLLFSLALVLFGLAAQVGLLLLSLGLRPELAQAAAAQGLQPEAALAAPPAEAPAPDPGLPVPHPVDLERARRAYLAIQAASGDRGVGLATAADSGSAAEPGPFVPVDPRNVFLIQELIGAPQAAPPDASPAGPDDDPPAGSSGPDDDDDPDRTAG